MSPQQEAKFDRLYDLVNDIHGDMKVVKNNQEIHANKLIDHEQKQSSLNKDVDDLKKDKAMVKGAIWFGGSAFGLGALHFLIDWFKK